MKTSVLLVLALHLSRNSKDPIFYPTFKETKDVLHANFYDNRRHDSCHNLHHSKRDELLYSHWLPIPPNNRDDMG